jgi:hypothetical protein
MLCINYCSNLIKEQLIERLVCLDWIWVEYLDKKIYIFLLKMDS